MENLLRLYRKIEAAIECLNSEVNRLVKGAVNNDISDYIQGMALKVNCVDIQASNKSHISDKTSNIALKYQEKFELENEELLWSINNELLLFEVVFEKLNIGLRALPIKIKKVIDLKYFDNLSWYEIEDKALISKAQAQRYRRQGVEMLCVITRLTIKQYDSAMQLLTMKMN